MYMNDEQQHQQLQYQQQLMYQQYLHEQKLQNHQENLVIHASDQSQVSNESTDKKEDKIWAARQKLKKFQKEGKKPTTNGSSQQGHEYLAHQSISGRSTPSSTSSSNAKHTSSQSVSTFPLLTPPISSNDPAIKEQLQLHVQTIGILVAEKAELQSKLQQYQKKADKKQDECDELMGRLKASRQKISDLERQVQQLSDSTSSSSNNSNSISNANSSQYELQRLNNELNSKEMLINELKMLLSESNEKLSIKQIEMQKLSQVTLDLKSHLEVVKMRESSGHNYDEEILKLREVNTTLETRLDKQRSELNEEFQDLVERYKKQIENLVDQINRMTDEREEAFTKIENLEHRLAEVSRVNSDLAAQLIEVELKAAQSTPAVIQSQQQKNSDEESKAREKIDLLENEIRYFKQQIEILLHTQQEMNVFLNDKELSIANLNKLLEKYESDREKFNLLLEQTHSDKQTLSRCLKQNNELKDQLTELQDAYVKLTNSNLDLASELESERFKLKQMRESLELESAGGKSLQVKQEPVEHFEVKEESVAVMHSTQEITNKEQEVLSSDWGDDATDSVFPVERQNDKNNNKSSNLMNTVKERIEYLEKENKDLNDYIALVNQQLGDLQETEAQQNSVIQTNINQIKLLKEEISHLEAERIELTNRLANLQQLNGGPKPIRENLNSLFNGDVEPSSPTLSSGSVQAANHFKNMKLLEEKFNKVMSENADLKEKNQELEHVIQQLQFETETIIDYITMYQVERTKLNEKYKIKDEAIRTLSTQLQVNKLALNEIYSYLNAFIQLQSQLDASQQTKPVDESESNVQNGGDPETDATTETKQKKFYLLFQIQKLLNDLTFNSSSILTSMSSAAAPVTSPNLNSRFQASNPAKLTTNQLYTQIDPSTLANFKNETIQCSNCYGDLFVV